MKNIKATVAAAIILSAVTLPMTGCISVKREVEPSTTSTTTTTVRPSVVSPSTTVERTTTY